jgi:hypothetical protein
MAVMAIFNLLGAGTYTAKVMSSILSALTSLKYSAKVAEKFIGYAC